MIRFIMIRKHFFSVRIVNSRNSFLIQLLMLALLMHFSADR